jgi:prephenate dehydrogenase
LTPTARTDPKALNAVRELWEAAGSVVSVMDPFVHDWVLGAVSHLPHVAAFSLINALSEVQDRLPDVNLLGFSGGGLRDATRIAASSPEMWRDIFVANRENVVKLIEVYERYLAQLKQLIAAGDGAGIEKELARAKQVREGLK